MNDSLNNKELVAAGHEFAKALSSDTAIIDIAKMVSRLAERLDCTTTALREMTKQRDALAAKLEVAWRAGRGLANDENTESLTTIQTAPALDSFSKKGDLPTTIKSVADLYEVSVPGCRATIFTTDTAEAKDCAGMGWKVQEYVKLEGYQAAMQGEDETAQEKHQPAGHVENCRNSEKVQDMQVSLPSGCAVVPVEPTPEMLAEICLVDGWTERALRARYKAMLAAVPQPEVK